MGAATKKPVKMTYSLVPNTLPGTSGYHRALSHIDSKDGSTLFANVASKLPGQTAAGVELVWNSIIESIEENLAKHQYRTVVGGNAFELAIPGSTESVNGAPTEGVYVSVTPSSSLRGAAAGITPTYGAADDDAPTLKQVARLQTNVTGQIAAAEPFRLVGNNITAAGDDETIAVIAADGTEAMAEVIREDGYGMFIDARLSTALPPGKSKVVLKTHGKRTPEGELRALSKSVTILAGSAPTDAPTATSWVSDGMEGEPIDLESSSVTVNGTKLAGATKVQFMYSEDGAVFCSADVGEATDTSATAQCGFTGTPTQAEGFLRVVTPNGTTNSIPCTFSR